MTKAIIFKGKKKRKKEGRKVGTLNDLNLSVTQLTLLLLEGKDALLKKKGFLI